MPSTIHQRAEQIKTALSDVEIVSFKEATVLTLRWIRYEWLILKRDRIQRRIDKHEDFIKECMHVFNARHEMKGM